MKRGIAWSAWLAVVSWAGLAGAEPNAQTERRIQRVLEQVQEKQTRGQAQHAEKELARALGKFPTDGRLWLAYGQINASCSADAPARSQREREDAARVWAKLPERPEKLETDPLWRAVWLYAAVARAAQGRFQDSLERAKAAGRSQDGLTVACLRRIAILAVNANQLALAERTLLLARNYFSQDLTLASELGLVLLARGDAQAAVGPLSERFAAEPRSLEARRDLAYALAAAGRPGEGYELLARASQACSEQPACGLELARLALEAKAPTLARDHARALVEREPQLLDAWFLLGEAQVACKELDAARYSYQQVLALSPHNLRAEQALEALPP